MNTREYVSWQILKSDENCPLATYLRNVSADDSSGGSDVNASYDRRFLSLYSWWCILCLVGMHK